MLINLNEIKKKYFAIADEFAKEREAISHPMAVSDFLKGLKVAFLNEVIEGYKAVFFSEKDGRMLESSKKSTPSKNYIFLSKDKNKLFDTYAKLAYYKQLSKLKLNGEVGQMPLEITNSQEIMGLYLMEDSEMYFEARHLTAPRVGMGKENTFMFYTNPIVRHNIVNALFNNLEVHDIDSNFELTFTRERIEIDDERIYDPSYPLKVMDITYTNKMSKHLIENNFHTIPKILLACDEYYSKNGRSKFLIFDDVYRMDDFSQNWSFVDLAKDEEMFGAFYEYFSGPRQPLEHLNTFKFFDELASFKDKILSGDLLIDFDIFSHAKSYRLNLDSGELEVDLELTRRVSSVDPKAVDVEKAKEDIGGLFISLVIDNEVKESRFWVYDKELEFKDLV